MSSSRVFRIGPHWHGFLGVSRFIMFGDSYTDIRYLDARDHPSAENPLGIKFPGVAWTVGMDKPNWVGHLITKYCPHPRFDPSQEEQSQEYRDDPLLIYNYARGGDRVEGVARQISIFLRRNARDGPDSPQWNANNSLFLTWVGINDCSNRKSTSNEATIEVLFELQEDLYSTGARNFVFIDVPPVHKGPSELLFSGEPFIMEAYGHSRNNWNEVLRRMVGNFAAAHEDATVLFFSATETFQNLMEDPTIYGFSTDDVREFGGAMWSDHIHPTSRVHDFLANDIAEFLNSVEPPQQ